MTSTPDSLIGDEVIQKLAFEVVTLEKAYSEATRQSVVYKQERDLQKQQAIEIERLKQEALRLQQENADKLEKKNKDRVKQAYSQFSSMMDDVQMDVLLSQVSSSDYGRLGNILKYVTYDKLMMLIGKTSVTNLNLLLPHLGGGEEDLLAQLLDNILSGQESYLDTLIPHTKDDKTDLITLLTRLNRDAREADALMDLAGDKNEASVLVLLNQGRSVLEIKQMMNTTSGRQNAPDVTTISGGVPGVGDATTLLNTPGVKGSAADTLLLLAHAKVNNVITDAEELLNKKGTATDALALLNHGPLSRPDAVLLMDTTGIKNQGADAVNCLLRPVASVPHLVFMLNLRNASDLYSYMDPTRGEQTFNFVYTQLSLNNDQTFWGGHLLIP